MKFTQEEIENFITEIAAGKKLITIENKQYYLYFPTREERLKANYIYHQKLLEFQQDAIPTEQELLKVAHNQSIYTLQDEKKYYQLEDKYLHLLKRAQASTPQFRLSFDKKLKEIKKELDNLSQKRNYVTSHSANYLSEQYKINYLLCCCVRNEKEERMWPDVNVMLDVLSLDNYQSFLNEFVKFINGLPIEKIRAVARSSLWQAIYAASVNSNQQLFNTCVAEWDINKILLVHWSNIYRNAFQNYGNVPDNILENDAAFDEWLDQSARKGLKS